MKRMVVGAALLLLTSTSAAQDPGSGPVELEDAGAAAISSDPLEVRDLVDGFLAEKGWSEGVNVRGGREFFLAVGVATIPASAGSRDFNVARINAFGRAFTAAKGQMSEYYAVEVRTEAESLYREGTPPQRAGHVESGPTLLDKSKRLAHAKLDELLRQAGVADPASASDDDIAEVVISDEYRDLTETLSRSVIAGLQAYKIFETKNDGRQCQIAVVAIHSELLGQMASALNGVAVELPPKTPKQPLSQQLPTDDDALLTTMGVQQRIDENGRLVLVSFGQAAPRTDSQRAVDRAYGKARTKALGQIRSFAGENALSSSLLISADTVEEFSDGTAAYSNEEFYQEEIRTRAAALEISGITTVKRWQAKHPLGDGTPVVGVVIAWSPDQALAAQSLAEDMVEGTHNSAGAAADDSGFAP